MAKYLKLILRDTESAQSAMASEDLIQLQWKLAQDVKERVWEQWWCNSDLVCTLSVRQLVTSAVERVRQWIPQRFAKPVKERKLRKRTRLWLLKLIREPLMERGTLSMEKVTKFLILSQVMSSSRLKRRSTRYLQGKVQISTWKKK